MAAKATRVKLVLLVMLTTVPITEPELFLMIAPTANSVVNNVPTPVTVDEAVKVVIVPLRAIFPSFAAVVTGTMELTVGPV